MNPWHGIDAWEELKYDLRHPVRFIRGTIANVNHVPRTVRRLSGGVMLIGLANVIVGLVILVRG
jgi:hypothetical protein